MEIRFIEDKELDLNDKDSSDLLGTKPYSETLFEVIKNSNGKQNIGLFGGWGSGKSTIIKTLESLIKSFNISNSEKQIAYFKFDAWKYSNDDFRRSFIIAFNEKFQKIDKDKLEDTLYNEITYENIKQNKIHLNYPKLIPILIIGIIIFCIIIIAMSDYNPSDRFLASIFTVFASFLFLLSGNTFRLVPNNIKKSKIIEAEKFEETFKIITNSLFGIQDLKIRDKIKGVFGDMTKYEKLVVVIDNLDRCDKENLMVTLSSMKNFLENDKIIFVLPVDENGITSFLNKDKDDADEYLRKIFHQIIRLKKFTPKELVEFTKELNKKYDLKLTNNGVRLICQEFTTNPRKIIQFLNNLQTERNLISRQIKEKYIHIDYCNEADDFLIKLLIIKQEWGELYKIILDDIQFLNKLNDAIKGKIEFENGLYKVKVRGENVFLKRNQKRFFSRNTAINYPNIEPFILNVDFNRDVPDELRSHIENGEINEAFALLSIDRNDVKPTDVILLLNEMEGAFDSNNNKFGDYVSISSQLIKILMVLMEIPNFKSEIKSNFVNYSFIDRIYSNEQFVGLIEDLKSIDSLCQTAKWFYEEKNYSIPYQKLITYIIEWLLEGDSVDLIKDKNKYESINFFVNTFSYNQDLIEPLKSILSSKIIKLPGIMTIMDIFESDVISSQTILSENSLLKLLIEMKNEKIEDPEILRRIIDLTDESIKSKHISNKATISEFTNYYFGKLDEFIKSFLKENKDVFTIDKIINKLKNLVPLSNDENLVIIPENLDKINSILNAEYSKDLDEQKLVFYDNFFNLILNIMHLDPNKLGTYSDDFEKHFNMFFKKDENKKINKIINKIYQKEVEHFSDFETTFYDELISKLEISKDFTYVNTLVLMLKNGEEKKKLTDEQKLKVIDLVVEHFIYYLTIQSFTKILIQDLIFIEENYTKLFEQSVNSLKNGNLKEFVYNINKAEASQLIKNTFVNYLNEENHFKSFEKFLKFIKGHHSEEQQLYALLGYAKSNYKYDWLFSLSQQISKPILNKLVLNYLNLYKEKSDNTDFLKNLLKLNFKELYKPSLNILDDFLNNIEDPTKYHKRKIKLIKEKF